MLQQYLPFTVLKLKYESLVKDGIRRVATVLTVYGIETISQNSIECVYGGCNSTYRLRY